MGLFDSWQKGVAAGKENRRDRIMGEFGQKALGGDQDALAQVYGVDTNAGMQLQQYASQQQAAQQQAGQEDAGRAALMFAQTGDPQYYAAWRGSLASLPNAPQLPEALSPEDIEPAKQSAQAFAQAYGGFKGTEVPSAIRELQMLQQNPELAKLDMQRRQAGFGRPQLIQTADGYAWATPEGASPLNYGGPQPRTSEVPFAVDPSLPPEVQADIRATEASGREWTQAPNIEGPRVMPAPKESAPSELDRRLQLAGQLGATPDQMRQMVIGREGAAAGAKPLPVGALNQLLSVEDALGATSNVSAIIKKHAERMQKGELDVYPEDAIGARFRTTIGRTNQNDVNVNEFRADMTRIVNESLRLNKGVQTEGDAQRATQELMAANDQKTAARALKRLAEINSRAVKLQRQKAAVIRKNYGQDENGDPVGAVAQPAQGAVTVRSADDYNRLPSGSLYIAPDGTQRRKK